MDYNITYREKDGGIQCIISYKDNNGKWKTRSKQGFKTQRESKPWQNKTLDKLKGGLELEGKLNEEYEGITFGELKEIYLKELALYREPYTVISYNTALKKFNDLEDKVIADIGFLDIKNIVNDMIKEELAIPTIESYVKALKIFLNVAVDEYKIITENPLEDNKIKLPRIKEDKKIKALNRAELDKLIDEIGPAKDRMIAIIASKCGLRAGEIIGLTWDDVDFKNMDLDINKQWKKLKTGEYGFGTLKTKNSYRKVPFSPFVKKELLSYKKVSAKEFKYNRLFIERKTPSVCQRFSRKLKRLGLNNSIHDLRHTYATNLVAGRVDFKTVAEFMGDSVEMVIQVYAHFNEDMYEAGREKVNKLS